MQVSHDDGGLWERWVLATEVGHTIVHDEATIEGLVHERFPDAEVHPTDLTGSGDHWHVVIVDASFAGMPSFKRQRELMSVFRAHIESGAIHALDMKCLTPDELVARHGGEIPAPFRPHAEGQGEHPA